MERQKNMNGQRGSRVRVHPWKKITNMENLVSWGSVHKKVVVHKLSLADSHCIDQFLLLQMNQLFLLLFRFPDIYGQKNFQEKKYGRRKIAPLVTPHFTPEEQIRLERGVLLLNRSGRLSIGPPLKQVKNLPLVCWKLFFLECKQSNLP